MPIYFGNIDCRFWLIFCYTSSKKLFIPKFKGDQVWIQHFFFVISTYLFAGKIRKLIFCFNSTWQYNTWCELVGHSFDMAVPTRTGRYVDPSVHHYGKTLTSEIIIRINLTTVKINSYPVWSINRYWINESLFFCVLSKMSLKSKSLTRDSFYIVHYLRWLIQPLSCSMCHNLWLM